MDQAWGWGARGRAEIYLPWPSFESLAHISTDFVVDHPSREAHALAAKHHPAWDALSRGAKQLHARNSHQVLGQHLDDPVAFVLCWTPDGSLDGTGSDTGGTGQALRIAVAYDVPVFNLQRSDHRARVKAMSEEG